jgi:hypothetical protein
MFLVLRVLFDVPENVNPNRAGAFGMPSPAGPKDPHQIPRFPVALVDDIPLMLVGGYSIEGLGSSMEAVLAFFKENGQLHPKPLAPNNDPLSAIVHLMNSPQWIYTDTNLQNFGGMSLGSAEDNDREKSMLMEQLLRLIDSVYRLPADVYGNRLPCCEPPESAWQKVVSEVSTLKIKWDPRQNMFVFPDGSHLSPAENNIYRRQIWKLTGLGFEDAEIVLERKSDNWVSVMVWWAGKAGATLRPGTLFLFDGKDMKVPLEMFPFTSKVGMGGGTTVCRTIRLIAGSELTARLVVTGYSTNSSPLLKP